MEAYLRLSRSIVESPEFNSKTCGVWDQLFAAPSSKSSDETETRIRERLTKFLTKAFRRPVESEQIERYTEYVVSQLRMGEAFENAMKDVVAATLASPKFLYLYDLPTGESDSMYWTIIVLASRLSFFCGEVFRTRNCTNWPLLVDCMNLIRLANKWSECFEIAS
ncbi:MAG: DUF1595 domain-containing protein [Pirellulaceae bacterium]